jgi:energy-coupling factor transporter ATP-binding protein EcfA2
MTITYELPFHLPIEYLDKKVAVPKEMQTDLELLQTLDPSGTPLYHYLVQLPDHNVWAKQSLTRWTQYYTADVTFLRQQQQLLKTWNIPALSSEQRDDMSALWQDIEGETAFCDKYHFIDYQRLRFLNRNAKFMQLFTVYNMTSPILSLLVPIVFLILPFFILRMQGIQISITHYTEVLKKLFGRHQLGQLFQLQNLSMEKLLYVGMSLFFYVFQMVQNVLTCRRFYNNMHVIHKHLLTTQKYVNDTIDRMIAFEKHCANYATFAPFQADVKRAADVLQDMAEELASIEPYTLKLSRIPTIGYAMKTFYNLYNTDRYHAALQYSFAFHGYLDNMQGVADLVRSKTVCAAKYVTGTKRTVCRLKNVWYPAVRATAPVKNNVDLSKRSMLITGPNAAGKTTLLKATLLNLLFIQQTGFAFCEQAKLTPFDQLHCYINIPDTSGRDSLFQAEARRCKDILDAIASAPRESRHFCMFDELYSGTNPYEAIGSACAFLQHLAETYPDRVRFMLTTHFIALCKKLDTNKRMQNGYMDIQSAVGGQGAGGARPPTASGIADNFVYTYKLRRGTSTIKGGVKVLRDLAYPPELIAASQKIIEELYV